ncbi:F-box domain-containing protein [Favolaschia claudopus]|uniref:F-box domain-containing protein n=1 Tax=Favolaschia claudopus TaxID=2862362 RepID=A0AAW0ECS9_9AGAR
MSAAANLRKQVADLTSATSQQRQLLTEMEAGLEDLQNQLQSIVYPILTLPPEITAEIFFHCLHNEPKDTIISNAAPLLLTQVCSAWREIAVTTPTLWQTFAVELNSPHELPKLSQIAQLWFKRAKKCPLSIRMRGELVANDTFLIFMKVLRRHSRDIHSLELHLDAGDIKAMDSLLPNALDLTMLESLVILINVLSDVDDDPAERNALAMFQNSPVLRTVLTNLGKPSSILLPWQQLTEFKGQAYKVGACLEALRLMPNLVRCAFAAYEYSSLEAGCNPVVHFKMQDLTLLRHVSGQDEDTSTSSDVLQFLTLPVLQSLIVERTDTFSANMFDLFLKRSSPPLRKLTVHPYYHSARLHLSTSFTTLDLSELEVCYPDCDFIPLFFDVFSKGDPRIFPNVQRLSFPSCSVSPPTEAGDFTDLVTMLRLAAGPITERRGSMQSFYASTHSRQRGSADVLAPFQKLREMGMDVRIEIENLSASYL